MEISDSGSVVSIDMPFNLDRNLQRFHEEDKSDDMGPSDVIMDFKEVTTLGLVSIFLFLV